MKIIAQTEVEVILSEDQIKSLAMSYLYKTLDWKNSYFIDNDKVCDTFSCGGSHSWNDVKFIREATEEDYFAAGIFKILKK